ncbi:MAG: hypothetical protein J5606_04905 [Bacteroidales bacterium]|nr:hypothetical protein [Bacteroidales bacterium]
MESLQKIQCVFAQFSKLKILVVGDVMLDDYVVGTASRLSPEAPVPVVDVEKRYVRLGGAANVALNLKALGATPILCSVIGKNEKDTLFLQTMQEADLPTMGIVQSPNRKITVKHRVLANNVQLLRLDDEQRNSLSEEDRQALMGKIVQLVDEKQIDAILFEDYDKGVIDTILIDEIVKVANAKHIPITIDPKKKNFQQYHHATIFKPNFKELKEGLNVADLQINDNAFVSKIEGFMQQKQHKMLLLTLSENGVMIIENTDKGLKIEQIPAHRRHIADVSGAGDTVLSVATLCLTAQLSPKEVAEWSNLAGGIVCEYAGVVAIDKDRFYKELVNLYTA